MMRMLLFILSALLLVPCSSCNKQEEVVLPWTPAVRDDDDKKEEEGDNKKDTLVVETAKPRYVWIDASANFRYFANDKARILSDLKEVKNAGFTDVIVDVRPTEGVVLWDSRIAPHATRLAAWLSSGYGFVTRTADFDYLQAFIDYGHELGLKVNAAINTFVGGYRCYYGLGDVGPIFDGSIPKDWATMVNTSTGIQSSYDLAESGSAIFLNPANPEVQDYVLSLLGELAAYDLDGIILDRCRYDDYNLQSEFSDISRSGFEEYLGRKLSNWPGDVMSAGQSSLGGSASPTQKAWLSYRAKTIHDFIVKASDKVHSVSAEMRFGVYVGAWYSSYYYSGVNWASPKYDPRAAGYYWADADYKNYGFADHCDFMMLGCYAGADSVYGNVEWTMQGFCKQGEELLCGDTVFAGGPDIGNASGFENGGREAVIPKTIDACINAADGYFVFDLCHIRMYDYWDAFKKGFDNYLNNLTNN